MPGETLILWVDPVTRLPVQVETGPYTMTDLHFDVPLEDVLFDTNVPAGYNLAAAEKPDSWDLLKFSGQVVDERGKPIAGVEVEATDRIDTISPGGYGFGGGSDKSDKDGRFNIDAGDQAYNLHDDPIRLEFRHPDFLYARLEDMRLLPPEQRLDLHVRLRDGQSVSGTVVDSQGRPITVRRPLKRSMAEHYPMENRVIRMFDGLTARSDLPIPKANSSFGGLRRRRFCCRFAARARRCSGVRQMSICELPKSRRSRSWRIRWI